MERRGLAAPYVSGTTLTSSKRIWLQPVFVYQRCQTWRHCGRNVQLLCRRAAAELGRSAKTRVATCAVMLLTHNANGEDLAFRTVVAP